LEGKGLGEKKGKVQLDPWEQKNHKKNSFSEGPPLGEGKGVKAILKQALCQEKGYTGSEVFLVCDRDKGGL